MVCFRPRPRSAFTLIELVIIVVIIAILAAISGPNFERAQTWAKVTRAASDMHTLNTGIACYSIDNNGYPSASDDPSVTELSQITTPIAYITSVPRDIFGANGQQAPRPYDYVVFRFHTGLPLAIDTGAEPWLGGNLESLCYPMEAPVGVSSFEYGWFVFSRGPDQDQEYDYTGNHPRCVFDKTYDPTNGTVSSGDLFRASDDQLIY